MDEYVDRFALRDALYDADAITMRGVKIINQFPEVDAVPVVRCKDCKNWEHGDCYRLELSRPDDFCSYGKRKEGAGNEP